MQCEVTKCPLESHDLIPWKNANLCNYSLGQSSIAKIFLALKKGGQRVVGECTFLACISIFVLSIVLFHWPALVSHAGWSNPTRIPRDFCSLTSCSRDSNGRRSSFSLYANLWECTEALNVTHSWFSSFAALNSFESGARITSMLLNMHTHSLEYERTHIHRTIEHDHYGIR